MNAYYEYYAPEYRLGVASRWCIDNANKVAYLNHVKKTVFENLDELTFQFNWLCSGLWSSWPSSEAVQSSGQGSKYSPLVP